jgi:sugar O-acyltransferase (sialic acid O-acetyltransferase NeuD family)
MHNLLLIGGGGHCRSVIDVIESQAQFKIFGIVDSNPELNNVLGYPVKGGDGDISYLREICPHALVTVGHLGSYLKRAELYERLVNLGFNFPVIISPRAYVSRHAKVSSGTVIMHDALVNAGAQVGENCIVNSKALIEHDAIIEDHCHVSTAAVINGGVKLGRGSFFGSQAVTKQYINIAPESFIKAGSVVK